MPVSIMLSVPLTSAMGRLRPLVTERDFFSSARCYAGPDGRVRPFSDDYSSHVIDTVLKIFVAAFADLNST